jgi:chaperonin GroES
MRTYSHHEQIVTKPLVGNEKTCGNLFGLDDAEDIPLGARVVSVGSGKVLENGKRLPFKVRPGDGVILRKNAGSESGLNGENRIIIVDEDDILLIFERSRV